MIPLLQYAEIAARRKHFAALGDSALGDEAVRRSGVRLDDFHDAESHWSRTFSEQAAAEDVEEVTVFGQAFGQERRRLRAESPSLESLGPLPPAEPEQTEEEHEEDPSRSAGESAPEPAAHSVVVDEPQPAPRNPSIHVAPPFVAPPPIVAREINPDETAYMVGTFVAKPATPFAGTTTRDRLAELALAAEEVPSSAPRKGETAPSAEIDPDGTAMIPAGVFFAQPQTGSFRDRLGAVAVPVAAPVSVVGEAYASADPDVTAAPFLNRQPVVPFNLDVAAARTPASIPVAPRDSESSRPDATVMVRSPLAVVAASDAPFNKRLAPAVVPSITVDEYARLRAELRYYGDESQVWERAGITTEDGKAAIQAKYFELFRNNPGAQAEFQQLLRAHLAKLSSGEES